MKENSNVLENARRMAEGPSGGVGPDIAIVVSSSDEEAVYWQERLTGDDKMRGAGPVIKKEALVFSVSETNWRGPAGNALGTLNGFVRAAEKAREWGLTAGKGRDIRALAGGFSAYCADKSVSMFHAAGKGTRMSPLPASECNSKSNIKLPGMVRTGGRDAPVTALESVIRSTSIYAPSRKGRLGVFWGDQVVINEADIDFDGCRHVEIFAQRVPLDEDISNYGALIPRPDGSWSVMEKAGVADLRKMLEPGDNRVYRSIGSFTVSLEMLNALIGMEICALEGLTGTLNTDTDWWQALTSRRDEYVRSMSEKNVPAPAAEARWEKVKHMWDGFQDAMPPDAPVPRGKIGVKDVGEGALWWDYGRIRSFFDNIRLLAGEGPHSAAARVFYGAEASFIKGPGTGTVAVENSLILGSAIGSGALKSCVVVGSALDSVRAENSVIIGSDIIELNSDGALCYNVVSGSEHLRKGEVAVNVFHPEMGKIPMRADLSRDGRADWESGEKVRGNLFSYGEMAGIMKRVSREDSERARDTAAGSLRPR